MTIFEIISYLSKKYNLIIDFSSTEDSAIADFDDMIIRLYWPMLNEYTYNECVFILLHEIGHLVNGWYGDTRDDLHRGEYNADVFAVTEPEFWEIARQGAKTYFLKQEGSWEWLNSVETHPSLELRYEHIKQIIEGGD